MGVVASMCIGLTATRTAVAQDTETIVVSGTLNGSQDAERHDIGGSAEEKLPLDLFHIGEFWISVTPDTLFHRWLSQGIGRKVVIRLTTNSARFGDVRNVRILSGTLKHETASNPTPSSADVEGRLPRGNLPTVHILYLKDELTGSLGEVTFETADLRTARKFDAYFDTDVIIVIQIM